jgi:hypothetical protein
MSAVLSSTSSSRRRDWGPQAEPLLGVPGLEPLYLGEPQLCREAHRADVGGLGAEHHRLAGKDAVEPVECRRARLGGVPESPRPRQEQVTEIGLPRGSRATVPRCSPEQDLADHRPVEINDETPGPPLGRPGHLALKLVTRPGAAEVGVHLWRRQQLDERRTVPGLGLTEHEPLGPDRLRRPGDGSELSHVGQLISGLGSDQDSRTDQPTGPGPTLTYGAGPYKPRLLGTGCLPFS